MANNYVARAAVSTRSRVDRDGEIHINVAAYAEGETPYELSEAVELAKFIGSGGARAQGEARALEIIAKRQLPPGRGLKRLLE